MDREDIIRMAEEAQIEAVHTGRQGVDAIDVLLGFANIVAAAEREACAKLAASTVCDVHVPTGVRVYGTRVADAIRARGEA